MSRKRRKRTSTKLQKKEPSSSRRKGIWWKLLLGFCGLLIAGGFFAYNRAVAFLHSDAFRKGVSSQVGAELGSVGEFGDFKWDGLSGENESFESTGEGAVSKIEASDISLDVKLDYFKRDKFRLKNVRVNRVDVELDLSKDFVRFEMEKKEKGFIESLLPNEVELLDSEISELNATVHSDSGKYSVSGVNIETVKDENTYRVDIKGGVVNLPFSFLKTARLEQGELVQSDEEIYVNDAKLKIFESGTVMLNGVVDLSPRARQLYDLKGALSGLKCKDVFPNGWHRHLTGKVRGKFNIKPYEGTSPRINGWLEIQKGTLQALPILNKVSYYLAEPKYRTLEFQKFDCDFERVEDQITLRKIKLTSKELLQVEGNLKIDGENLDGIFDVGVPAFYLDKIPGAKNGVFKPGKDQLLWTKVKIGGTFDDITEDLSDRLIMAAGEEMIRRALSMGGEVISPETVGKLLEGGKGVMDNATDILKGNKGILEGGVDTAKGVIEGLTGSNKKEDPNKNEEKEDGGGLMPELPEIPEIPKIPLPFLQNLRL